MADNDDLEYDGNLGAAQTQGVRKNISLKLKAKGRGRGRRGGKSRRSSTKKSSADILDEEYDENEASTEKSTGKPFDSSLDEVISKLETPAFSPMDRAFPEPLHQNQKLKWDHKVNLIGEKVIDPSIHCCEKCTMPILTYGRLIPCKHVFCLECAKKIETFSSTCPKCNNNFQRVESVSLGTVYMCSFGGSKHNSSICGRTYLSQRDLQAHVNHRHKQISGSSGAPLTMRDPRSNADSTQLALRDPRNVLQVDSTHSSGGRPPHPPVEQPVDHAPHDSPAGYSSNYQSTMPVNAPRSNLITVTIQDEGNAPPPPPVSNVPPPMTIMHPPPPQYAPPPSRTPPVSYQPQATGYSQPPPPHPYAHPTTPYSQAPPTQTFTQPPIVGHHQSQITASMFSNPPPPVHHPPVSVGVHHQPAAPVRHPQAPAGVHLQQAPAGVHHPQTPAGVHHPQAPAGVHHPQAPAGVHHPQTPAGVHLQQAPAGVHLQQAPAGVHLSQAPAGVHHQPAYAPHVAIQRFPPPTGNPGYDEPNAYLQQWPPGGVPPPPSGLPPRPITLPPQTHMAPPQRAPVDPIYRQNYYQH